MGSSTWVGLCEWSMMGTSERKLWSRASLAENLSAGFLLSSFLKNYFSSGSSCEKCPPSKSREHCLLFSLASASFLPKRDFLKYLELIFKSTLKKIWLQVRRYHMPVYIYPMWKALGPYSREFQHYLEHNSRCWPALPAQRKWGLDHRIPSSWWFLGRYCDA